MFETPHLQTLKAMLPRGGRPVPGAAKKSICGTWPDLTSLRGLTRGWKRGHEEIVPGAEEVLKLCSVERNGKSVSMKLYVNSHKHVQSHKRFLTIASTSQSADLPFHNGPAGLGHYSVVSVTDDYRRCVALFHNAVLDVFSDDASIDPAAICRGYFDWAKRHLTSSLRTKLPKIELRISSIRGNNIVVTLTSKGQMMLDVLDAEELDPGRDVQAGVRILAAEDKEVILDGASVSSAGKVRVLAISKETLLVKAKDVSISQSR